MHYRFQADFCNPGKGNEKGDVENKVGYSRRNLFVPVPDITDFVAFNAALWEKCDRDAEREHYRKKRLIRELCGEALELAAENGRTDAESIRQCYYMVARKEFRPSPLRLDNDAPPLNYAPDLSVYDNLMGGEGHA